MTEISTLLLMFLVELLLIAVIASVALMVIGFLKKKRDRASVQVLVTRIEENEGRRQQENQKFLQDNFGLDGDLLESSGKKIMQEEKRFYQTLMNLYLKRDNSALETLHLAFEGATEPYRILEISRPDQTVQAAGELEDSEEMVQLRDENKSLSEELQITMTTMGRMLNEYAAMSTGDTGSDLDKGKMLEMFKANGSTPEVAEGEPESVAPAMDDGAETSHSSVSPDMAEGLALEENGAGGSTDQNPLPAAVDEEIEGVGKLLDDLKLGDDECVTGTSSSIVSDDFMSLDGDEVVLSVDGAEDLIDLNKTQK